MWLATKAFDQTQRRLAPLRLFQRRQTIKSCEDSLGYAYSRRFVRDFARLSAPLPNLMKDTIKFKLAEEQQQAFNELKRRLQTPLIRGHFDHDADTEVHTDASNVGLDAVLA